MSRVDATDAIRIEWINFKESTETNLSSATPYRKKRQGPREGEKEKEKEVERFAIAPSHLIGDGSRHRVGPPSWPV